MFGLIIESGFAGWIILLLFLAGVAAVTTVGRRWGRPGSTAAAWAVAVLAAGALGYGTGQRKVNRAISTGSAHAATQPAASDTERIQRASNRVVMLSQGTSEAAANYVLAGGSALLLCLLGGVMVFFRRSPAPDPAGAAAPVPQPGR
jgi:hypothetical protein